MQDGEPIDLSKEIDLDSVDLQNYKFRAQEQCVFIRDRFVPAFMSFQVTQDLDEIC